MTTTKNDQFQVTIWTILLLAATAMPSVVRGDEPSPDCLKCGTAERSVSLLSKIPYLSRFFKIAVAEDDRAGLPQDFERIGVDFDFEVCPNCPVACKAGVCQSTVRPQLLVIRKTASGQAVSTCGNEEPCCGKECQAAAACCEKGCEIICEEEECEGPSWERIIELTAKNAALEAVLEARESFTKEKTQFLEMLAELSMEKVALEGKVAAMAQQAEFTKEMLTLVAENARLKAQAEMAEVKLSMLHEMAKLAKENEQLRLSTRSRSLPAQWSEDVEYLPAGPHTQQPVRSAPPKRASYQEVETQVHPQPKLER